MKHFATWDLEADIQTTLQTLSLVAAPILQRCGPAEKELTSLLMNKQWAELLAFEVDYTQKWEVHHLIAVRQVLGLFQKLEPLDLGINREAEAYAKFIAAEDRCAEINRLFLPILAVERPDFSGFPPDVMSQLFAAQRLVARVLGKAPGIPELTLRFGPGATTSTKKLDACPSEKFSKGFACSEQLAESGYLESILRSMPHWVAAHSVESSAFGDVVDIAIHHGKLQFVPKNAKSFRSIVVEPSLNTIFQQGLRGALQQRLKRFGLDVTDQSLNQRLARQGSISGALATLDLSSASDTISRNLVKFLVPHEWYRLLDAARTRSVIYTGPNGVSDLINQEKFCSMGNAITFPLETLIFWSLCTVAGGSHAVCYGDDIIVQSDVVEPVVELLSMCGFTVNLEKSFWEGPFRESCGADYFKGIDIRPTYQKTNISCRDLFRLYNFFYRNFDDEVCGVIKDLIPRHLRLYGPDGYGDGHLISEIYPRKRTNLDTSRGYGGYRFDTFSLLGRRVRTRFPGDWVSPLYSVYLSGGLGLDNVAVEFSGSGFPLWDVPGSKGYERKSVYILG